MAQSTEARLASRPDRRRVTRNPLAPARRWRPNEIVIVARWGTLACTAIAVVAPDLRELSQRTGAIAALSVFALYAAMRTGWPISTGAPGAAQLSALAAEVAFCSVLACLTGAWTSPFLIMVGFAFFSAGVVAGARGLAVAVLSAASCVVIEAYAHPFGVVYAGAPAVIVQRIPELVGFGAIGAYAHQVFGKEDDTSSRLGWMNEVHALLLGLNRLAAEHPGLFTVDGAVQATVARIRDVLSPDVILVLLRHPAAGGAGQPWEVAFNAGVAIGGSIADEQFPDLLRSCAREARMRLCQAIPPGDGLTPDAESGLYVPIIGRGQLCGVIALERSTGGAFGSGDADALVQISHHAGLAIESARSFARLRNLGAQEERERIGRELHDEVGQSLAAVAFRIDRLHAAIGREPLETLAQDLVAIANDVRVVNGEIREKLAELRGGPTADMPLGRALEQLLVRVETRSPLAAHYEQQTTGHLPDVVEREMWRIACEAIRNVERHSGATHVWVSIRDEGRFRVLDIRDDGRGIDRCQASRPDAYGLIGMRERADLIDATLALDSAQGTGTRVQLRVAKC